MDIRNWADCLETPKPPLMQRKPGTIQSLSRSKRKYAISLIDKDQQKELTESVIKGLVPAVINALQPAERVARDRSPTKEIKLQPLNRNGAPFNKKKDQNDSCPGATVSNMHVNIRSFSKHFEDFRGANTLSTVFSSCYLSV